MKALSGLRFPAYANFQQKNPVPVEMVRAACDLSLLMSRSLPEQVTDIIQVQQMRKQAMTYLADVQCWWSKLYPPGTNQESDTRHHQLKKLYGELESEIEGTIQRALAALDMMGKIKRQEKRKSLISIPWT